MLFFVLRTDGKEAKWRILKRFRAVGGLALTDLQAQNSVGTVFSKRHCDEAISLMRLAEKHTDTDTEPTLLHVKVRSTSSWSNAITAAGNATTLPSMKRSAFHNDGGSKTLHGSVAWQRAPAGGQRSAQTHCRAGIEETLLPSQTTSLRQTRLRAKSMCLMKIFIKSSMDKHCHQWNLGQSVAADFETEEDALRR